MDTLPDGHLLIVSRPGATAPVVQAVVADLAHHIARAGIVPARFTRSPHSGPVEPIAHRHRAPP